MSGWSSNPNGGGGGIDTALRAEFEAHRDSDAGHVPMGYKTSAIKMPSGGQKIEVKHEDDAGSNDTAGELYVNVPAGENIG